MAITGYRKLNHSVPYIAAGLLFALCVIVAFMLPAPKSTRTGYPGWQVTAAERRRDTLLLIIGHTRAIAPVAGTIASNAD